MSDQYSSIIVRMPNWLGDLVMATPVLFDLKTHFPKASITAMCQGSGAELLIANPVVDEIFSFSRPNEFLRKQEKRDIISRIQQGKYDLGVLLTNSFSSAYWFWRGKVQHKVGYKNDGRSLFLNKRVSYPKQKEEEHLVVTYKRLLKPLGIELSDTLPRLCVTDKEREEAKALLKHYAIPKRAKLIGINPTAAYGEAKCWPQERFCALTEKLLQHPNYTLLYFGDRSGVDKVETICRGFDERVINLAGATSIRMLLALIEKCDLFLTNDSGPMHIAAALQTPLIALFGSTNEKATGPYQHGDVIHKHVECSPCYKRVCPIDFKCMKQISVDEVYQKCLKKLP